MKVITAQCHDEIEPHWHVQQSGWATVPGHSKKVFIVSVTLHDPRAADGSQNICVTVEEP